MAGQVFEDPDNDTSSSPSEKTFQILRNQTGLGNDLLPVVKGMFFDLQNRVEFSVNVTYGSTIPDYNLFSFYVDIIKLTDNSHFHRFDITNRFTNLMLQLTSIGDKSSDSDADFEYEFSNGVEYKITYTITMLLAENTANKVTLYHNQEFTYYETPVTLNPDITILDLDSTLDSSITNIGKGDGINIKGLTLVNSNINDIPTGDTAIQFSFRDTAANMENEYTVYKQYDPNGNYELINNQLDDNKKYKVIVTARWPLGYTTSVEGTNDLYVIPRPLVKLITPLNADDAIIASIQVKKDYTDNVYSERKIKFTFYYTTVEGTQSVVKSLVTNDILYDKETNSYGNSINRQTNAAGDSYVFNLTPNDFITLPKNGVVYKLKSEITLKYSNIEQKRVSNYYTRPSSVAPQSLNGQELAPTDFMTTTSVVAITDVTIDNTWALITNPDNSPSSNTALFSNSRVPLVGISGYFKKTPQFRNGNPKHLDTVDTKFTLEYTTGSVWYPVVRVVFKQKSSTDVTNNDAVYALLSLLSEEINPDGTYDNPFDANSDAIGTSQPEIVFYIPNNQDPVNANIKSFNENDKVQVRVTVKDTANSFGGSVTSATTYSAVKQIINKIESYDFVVGQSTEPWNSDVPPSTFLDVTMNGNPLPNVSKALFKSSSNNIIEEVDQGWKIVNTEVGTNGADAGKLPKAEIYLYANYNPSSNSFQVNQINGLGAYAIIDQHQGAREYPFFNIYTNPTTDPSTNKSNDYKSRLFHAPEPQFSGDTTTDSSRAGLTLLFTGTDNPSFRPDIPASRRIKYVLLPHDDNQDLTKTFGNYETELVKHIVLSTSSNASTSQAGNFNFTLSQSGLTTGSLITRSVIIKFSKNIVLNIPVDWKSIHAHSVKVSYGYKNSFGAGTWTNSNVAQLGGTGAPKLVGSSNNQTDAWSFSEATWVSTDSSGQQRTATYTGGIFSSPSFTGPVTITTTYGVGMNDIPNTDITFSILNPVTQAVIFSAVTRYNDLVVNVNNKTITGKIDYQMVNATTKTFNYSPPSQSPPPPQYVSIDVDPMQGNTLNYTVAYIVKNTNKGPTDTTEGLTVSKNVPNKYFPTNSSYSISGDSYKTFNTHGESSISFTLGFTPGLTHRIDGINVYFASPSGANGSNINKVRIATYKSSAPGLTPIPPIPLLTKNADDNKLIIGGDNQTALNVLSLQGTSSPHVSFKWGDFDVANITFEAYRDNRVLSGTSDSYVGAAYDTANYKESGSKPFATQIWNVPKLNKVSDYGAITLTGGVRNSSVPTTISWPSISDTNDNAFKYRLKMDKNGVTPSIHDEDLVLISKTLDINTDANAAYTVKVKFVFEPLGGLREESTDDVIVFSTIDVDVSGMDIRVQDPSDTSRVNLSWTEPVVNGGTNAVNIHSKYIEYLVSSLPANLSRTRLDVAPAAALIETLTGGKKEYTLPANTTVRMLYEFYMHIKAHIQYTVNANTQTTVAVPILDSTLKTPRSQYRVSTIPSVSLDNSPILNTLTVKPKLNLKLDARGVENEGFISVVILLTQDGTPNRPDGEQVLLVFPGTSVAPFSHDNVIPSISGSNLVSGSVSTTMPRNQLNTSLSTQSSASSALEYTLKIGAVDSNGKYLPSELTMPYSSDSGFVEGGSANPINYMVILTTRRGTDIDTGSFQYVSLPSVNNLSISYDNNSNQYSANFTISE